jgi:hypothetical protein
MTFKYLHETAPGMYFLDHRLVPEVRGMLCAMASRAPVGGVVARYTQLVEAVAEGTWEESIQRSRERVTGDSPQAVYIRERWEESGRTFEDVFRTWAQLQENERKAPRAQAEERLCDYPLHPKVQKFFNDFVGAYGHSSIMELTGEPAVYTENISWLTAWLLFDSPLCAGQEFSTRAVQHKDWPLARECFNVWRDPEYQYEGPPMHYDQGGVSLHLDPAEKGQTITVVNGDFRAIHDGWFEVFAAEVAWWTEHLSDPANREALGIADKEPFRPALDRARWALPGTIATGCAHTSNLRERARALDVGARFAEGSGEPEAVWNDIRETYRKALPGLADMGLREAVYKAGTTLPRHLDRGMFLREVPEANDVEVVLYPAEGYEDLPKRTGIKTYADATYNHVAQVEVAIQCSLAVARDWHRHRTMYPWHMELVVSNDITGRNPPLVIDRHYTPMSEIGKAKTPAMLAKSREVYDRFMAEGKPYLAALALPLGTRVQLTGQGGLRDVLYTMELRHHAHGANFEYKEQALYILDMLKQAVEDQIPDAMYPLWPSRTTLRIAYAPPGVFTGTSEKE